MCNEVTQKDLHDLLQIFIKKPFEAGTCEEGSIDADYNNKCESLFKLDYSLLELDNNHGGLSTRYPVRIFIPEYENGHKSVPSTASNGKNGYNVNSNTMDPTTSSASTSANGVGTASSSSPIDYSALNNVLHCNKSFSNNVSNIQPNVTFATNPASPMKQQPQPQQQLQQPQHTIYEDLYDINRIRDLITMARYARCRQRFVVPVIMYRGKYICRSATISVMHETYGRKVVDFAYDCINGSSSAAPEQANNEEDNSDSTDDSLMPNTSDTLPFSYDEVIKSDVQLLNTLNVTTIVDLMVENRKIKYFMPVSSSEKAHPENHYENFNLLSLPYPGCEFFKKFRDNNYNVENLYYNWEPAFNDAPINVPKIGPGSDLDINWSDYQKWDIVLMTQNYLKIILKYIQEEKSGLLVHCISGWDRTPLYISLLRLSLWADGLIHQSLNPMQMTYFTLIYDWYLFGHQLPDRLKRGEDIMLFCFHMLKYIIDDEFSIVEHRKRTKTTSSSGSSVIVLKTDCDDEQKEESLLNFDQDSNESYSNVSICDNTSTPAEQATPPAPGNALTNRSPNAKRSKTSPISVPGGARQRYESSSSTCSSWQVVTDTGSIDSVKNGSYMMHAVESTNSTPGNGSTGSSSSNGFVAVTKDPNSKSNGSKAPPTLRKQRLEAVRAIFINAHGKVVGYKFNEGANTFIGSLAEYL